MVVVVVGAIVVVVVGAKVVVVVGATVVVGANVVVVVIPKQVPQSKNAPSIMLYQINGGDSTVKVAQNSSPPALNLTTSPDRNVAVTSLN